jgi:two-component system phosphate regulon sensor histidine kinase PhoR
MDDGLSPIHSSSFQQMHDQTERMQHLVDDLLLLTRLETQQKKPSCVDVSSLINQICEEADSFGTTPGRIELILDTSVKLTGVEHELRSAFTNLLSNALKYSPDDTVVKVHWYKNEDCCVLDITDQGEGISRSDIHRVTERFYRVEVKRPKKVQGTGLGLAIVKHVLMRHEAKLNISSEPGKGSCFSCWFPVKRVCT